jgi:hypothetical protein
MNPQQIVEKVEREHTLTIGNGERYSGYAVLGVPFRSGHVLVLRRFPASSLGDGYTAVWLYDPSGRWTIYQDVPLWLACARYFSKAVRIIQNRIEIEWIGSHTFIVRVPEAELRWEISLKENWMSQAMNKVLGWLPDSFWRKEWVSRVMQKVAGVILRTGNLPLVGKMPNGQNYLAYPLMMWLISESKASLKDKDLGGMEPLQEQIKIDNYPISKRGLFAFANAEIEAHDPSRHFPLESPESCPVSEPLGHPTVKLLGSRTKNGMQPKLPCIFS